MKWSPHQSTCIPNNPWVFMLPKSFITSTNCHYPAFSPDPSPAPSLSEASISNPWCITELDAPKQPPANTVHTQAGLQRQATQFHGLVVREVPVDPLLPGAPKRSLLPLRQGVRAAKGSEGPSGGRLRLCWHEKLEKALKDCGYNIARRTVAKYREQLNIPVARLRKEL